MTATTLRSYRRQTPPPAVVTIGGYQGLAAAIIWQAAQDAESGDADAVAWLAGEGVGWLALIAPAHVDAEALIARALASITTATPAPRTRRPRMRRARGVGALVRAARRRAGLSQRELGKRAGMPYSSISDIERGKQRPRPDTLARLARALGVPAATFCAPAVA